MGVDDRKEVEVMSIGSGRLKMISRSRIPPPQEGEAARKNASGARQSSQRRSVRQVESRKQVAKKRTATIASGRKENVEHQERKAQKEQRDENTKNHEAIDRPESKRREARESVPQNTKKEIENDQAMQYSLDFLVRWIVVKGME